MSGKERIAIFPSRANLVLMKQRTASALKGLNLLKRKRDALEMHLRQISAELKMNREQAEEIMKEAIFSLAKARFLNTDFKPATVACPDRADVHLRAKNTRVIGVAVPTLELVVRPSSSLNFTGLSTGGGQVQIVREKFQEALKLLVAVASLEYSVKTIEEAVKQNKKRVNGLEYVVLPRYQNTAIYIRDELDEFEREDFYRLKRSQAKQQQKKSDFIKKISEREEVKAAKDFGVDFRDTNLRTQAFEIIGTKPNVSFPKLRKYVSKVMARKVVLETEEVVPLNLEATYSKAVLREKEPKKQKKYISSSEEEESSSEVEIKNSDMEDDDENNKN